MGNHFDLSHEPASQRRKSSDEQAEKEFKHSMDLSGINVAARIKQMDSDATMKESKELLHKEARVESRGVYGQAYLSLRAEDIKNNVASALSQNSSYNSVMSNAQNSTRS